MASVGNAKVKYNGNSEGEDNRKIPVEEPFFTSPHSPMTIESSLPVAGPGGWLHWERGQRALL